MGIKQKFICCLVFLMAFFVGCGDNFHTATINLADVRLSEVVAHVAAAYYLGQDGTLYCTGADSDAASFVTYKDSKQGIVAENVKSFVEMVGGGAYICSNNDLYIWNENEKPCYNYYKNPEHQRILQNVRYVAFDAYSMIYIDLQNNLYLVGEFLGEEYTLNQPKFLCEKVNCADIRNGKILCATADGAINSYGYTDSGISVLLNNKFNATQITDICLTNNYVVVICNNELWYYGDYENLVCGKSSSNAQKSLHCLRQDIRKVSCASRTIAALDANGELYVWGICISNDENQTDFDESEYYEAKRIAKKAKNVAASDGCIAYIDENDKSQIFYSSLGWKDFYGNSTDDSCVGINRQPCTWVN